MVWDSSVFLLKSEISLLAFKIFRFHFVQLALELIIFWFHSFFASQFRSQANNLTLQIYNFGGSFLINCIWCSHNILLSLLNIVSITLCRRNRRRSRLPKCKWKVWMLKLWRLVCWWYQWLFIWSTHNTQVTNILMRSVRRCLWPTLMQVIVES